MSGEGPEPAAPDPAVASLAAELGVELEYWDVQGRLHRAGTESLLGVLRAMGLPATAPADVAALRDEHDRRRAEAVIEPVVVAEVGSAPTVTIRVPDGRSARPVEVRVLLEAGDERSTAVDLAAVAGRPGAVGPHAVVDHDVVLPAEPFAGLPIGRHRLEVHGVGDEVAVAHLLVAPPRVPSFGPDDRYWGVFAPAYALPGGSGIGAHLGLLGDLAERVDGAGAKLVGTLPLLASWLDEPFEPSPYAPVSRQHWNELFLDLAALPELAALDDQRADLEGLHAIGHAANAKSRNFDYRHQYAYVHGVIERLVAARDRWPAAQRAAFETWRREHPEVERYARFRAYARQAEVGWQAWPEPARRGTLDDDDVDPEVVAFHAFAQYAMTRQLGELAASLRARGQRLYLDLPVGVGGDGYDTWIAPDDFAWGAATGAPPDEFFTEGQNWGFPPLRPDAARRSGHRGFADVLRAHLAVCGVLRLDHVMGFHRLYWVPDGAGAREGAYVRYPSRELYAVLAIEAHRHQAVVVGENLGTVPPEVTEAMADHGLLGMHVLQFNQPDWAGAEPVGATAAQLTSFGTHDTPTFAGWRHGVDIDQRHELELVGDDEAEAERARRRQQVENLRGYLRAAGFGGDEGDGRASDRALLEAVLRFLGDSDAPALLVSLDDLWLERNPQNIPGTPVDRPNWVQRSPLTLDELLDDPEVRNLLDAVQACRLGSHLRARGGSPP